MGKATIISEIGDGQYRIQPVIDKSLALSKIASLTAENTTITSRLTELTTEISTAETAVDYAETVLRAAINAGADPDKISTLQDEYNKAVNDLQNLHSIDSYLRLKKTANEKRISWLQQETADPPQVDAWCADLTEGGSGTVGTVELGRIDTAPIIRPGCPSHSAADDGQLQPLVSSHAPAVFYNYALLPGAAKWKPRYRTGTASNVDAATNTMDVALDGLVIAGHNCNQSTTLTGVTIEYMTCNAEAFQEGDDVLVEFVGQDWSTPKVVGFAHDPQPCGGGYWIRITLDGNDLVAGGQKFAIRYNDTNGDTKITAYCVVGAVGVDNGTVTIPAENYSLAGPFKLNNWDQQPAELLLHQDRDNAHTDLPTYALISSSPYLNMHKIHNCFEEDPDGPYVSYQLEIVDVMSEDSEFRDPSLETWGNSTTVRRVAQVSSQVARVADIPIDESLVVEGTTTDWGGSYIFYPDGLTVLGARFSRWTFGTRYSLAGLPVAQITAAQVTAAEADDPYLATNLATGETAELPLLTVSGNPGLIVARLQQSIIDTNGIWAGYERQEQLINPTFLTSGGVAVNWSLGVGMTYNATDDQITLGTTSGLLRGYMRPGNGYGTKPGGRYTITIDVESVSGTKTLVSTGSVLVADTNLVAGLNEIEVCTATLTTTLELMFEGSGTAVLNGVSMVGLEVDYYAPVPYPTALIYEDIWLPDRTETIDYEYYRDLAAAATSRQLITESYNNGITPSDLGPEYYAWQWYYDATRDTLLIQRRVRVSSQDYANTAMTVWLPTISGQTIVAPSGTLSESFDDVGLASSGYQAEYEDADLLIGLISESWVEYPATTQTRSVLLSDAPMPTEMY